MFDRVLIAVDGSECARRAAEVGLGLAKGYDAGVAAIHVVEKGTLDPGKDVREARHARGEEALESVAKGAADRGLAFERRLAEGTPHRAIAEYAGDCDADLVVLGRRGRRSLGDRILGSTTERILRRTDLPVLAVPCDYGVVGAGIETVLVTTDGSGNAERAGPYAADVAERLGATLHVLNAVDVQSAAGVFDAGGVSKDFVERLETRGREAIDRLVEGFPDELDVRTAVVRGTPSDAICEYAEGEGVDLVVISSTGQSNLSGQHLGSTTGRVLRKAGVPVLVITH